MKRIIFLAVAIAMVSVVVEAATNVVSVNVVGYNKFNVEPNGGFVLVAPSFDPIGGGAWTLKDLLGTNRLTQGAVPGPADKVYLWDTGSSAWKQFFQKADGNFYDAAVPPWTVPTNPAVAIGEGFFIQGGAATTNTVTMLGEVIEAGTQSTDIVPGFQTLGFPFSSDFMLGDMAFTNAGTKGAVPGPADKVYVFENGQYVQLFMKTDNKWYRADNPPWTSPTNVNIRIGQGFWYEAQNAFTNNESNPYSVNL